MSLLLNQLKDDELDFTVRFTDTDGNDGVYDFLDIVHFEGNEYVVVAPKDDDEGYVDIFRVIPDGKKEKYERTEDDRILEEVFEIFRIKNEDEFDFV
ncbi:MAG: DUF1292 domain-containing protein [Clostridia bacterium]|nr:DUF1292 domain-containing protein [Clostridia bacterium]